MNFKMLIILSGALAVLLLAFFLIKPNRPEVGSSGSEIGKALIKDFKPDDVRTVKLAKGDRQIQLTLKDGKWTIASKDHRPADEGRIMSLLNAIRDAKVKGDRMGSLETFELDEQQRLSIQVLGTGDKDLGRIVVGKSLDQATDFLLLGNKEKILEVDQNFSARAQVSTENEKKVLSVDKWYDLKLLRVPSNEVLDVTFQKGDQKWRIQKVIPGQGPVKPQSKEEPRKTEASVPAAEEKKNEKADGKKKEDKTPVWRVTEPEDAEADESACNSVSSAFSWLDAEGYADEIKPEELGLDKPVATTRVVLKGGATHTLVFGKLVEDKKNDSNSFVVAKLDDRPQIWKISKYNFENLTKPVDKLKKPKEEKKDEKADARKDGENIGTLKEKLQAEADRAAKVEKDLREDLSKAAKALSEESKKAKELRDQADKLEKEKEDLDKNLKKTLDKDLMNTMDSLRAISSSLDAYDRKLEQKKTEEKKEPTK